MSTIPDLSDRLAVMNDAYQEADGTGNEWPPDGTYQGLVDRFDFFEATSTGHAFLKTELKVVFPEDHAGRSCETVHDLEDPDRVAWVKKHLLTIGLEIDDLSLLEAQLHTVVDVPVEFVIKTSAKTNADGVPYRNVYVNQRLGDPMRSEIPLDDPGPAQEAMPVGASESDGDIPF